MRQLHNSTETDVRRSRDYCFTINNYTDTIVEHLKQNHAQVDYLVFGFEIGQSGTPHLQGFIQCKHPISLRRIKEILGTVTAHVESRKGSVLSAIQYCKKDGKFFEQGDPQRLQDSKENQQSKWATIIKHAEDNELIKIKELYPSEYIRYYKTLCSLQIGHNLILPTITNEWWHGPTGTGKSYNVWKQYPNHYQKELNKWWDNYRGEEVVVIEEWCPKNECTASQLKIWADRYPFTAQIKGGTLQKIRPKKIIITSNYTIDQCFQNKEDAEPIKRRFKQVYFPFKMFPPNPQTINIDSLDLSFLDSLPNEEDLSSL